MSNRQAERFWLALADLFERAWHFCLMRANRYVDYGPAVDAKSVANPPF